MPMHMPPSHEDFTVMKYGHLQVCELWNDADLEVRDELLMSKALSNSYAMVAAFAPLDAMPDMLAGRPSFRTTEAIDPSAFKMIGFARCATCKEAHGLLTAGSSLQVLIGW